jgi:LacI family transcriptional regulator
MYNDTPIMFFDKIIHETAAYKVTIPGEQAAFDAVDFLLNKNKKCKRFVGILGDERLSITQDRLSGFNRALREHQIKPSPGLVHYAHNSIEAGEIFEELWQSSKRPNCLFLMSDEILEGVMKKVYKLKLNLPQEMKMITMSDGFLPTLYNFEFPYIKTSGFDLGKAAAELLFKLMDNKPMTTQTYFIETPLVDPDYIAPLRMSLNASN